MNRHQIAQNVRTFTKLANSKEEDRSFFRSVLKNGKNFVALIDDDIIHFVPGHYALNREQIDSLDQRQSLASATVERHLNELCGTSLQISHPLYCLIDEAYLQSCKDACTAPSLHNQVRTYWLLRV